MPLQHRVRPTGGPRRAALGVAAAAAILMTGLLVHTAAQPGHAGAADEVPTEQPTHECADATEECSGTISVPKDWEEPTGEQIEVGFMFVPRTDQEAPAEGTVLYNMGGPGPSTPTGEVAVSALGPVLQDHDLLLVDLRGMGTSTQLECEDMNLSDPDSVTACGEEVAEDGPYFSTSQAVHDHDAVRSALGLEELTLFGNSYGTLVMQSYASHYPARVASMFLDSSIAIQDDGHSEAFGYISALPSALPVLDAVCADSAACAALPGDTSERLSSVLAELRSAGDTEAIQALAYTFASADDPVLGREFNASLAARLDGDPAPLERLLADMREGIVTDEEVAEEMEAMGAAELAYFCGDARYPFDPRASDEQRRAQLDAYYEEEQPFAPFTNEEVLSLLPGADHTEWCAAWPAADHTPPVDVTSPDLDVPVLVTVGSLDTTTTHDWGEAVAERFPRSTFVPMAYESHANWDRPELSGDSCPNGQMRAFMAEPEFPAEDHGCQTPWFRSQGSFPVTSADLPELEAEGLSDEQAEAVNTAFATASDAAVRVHPMRMTVAPLEESPGVRGGVSSFDAETGAITLDEVRYVEDTAVSGEVAPEPDGSAQAHLSTAGNAGEDYEVTLSWDYATAGEPVAVTGTVDGADFEASAVLPGTV